MKKNEVRIIGGQWRSRKLKFPDILGLRPTHDRVRETLFNWLGTRVVGAHCLDAFAGSGALGFEALSRGAASVLFVEKNRQVAESLSANQQQFEAGGADVLVADFFTVSTQTPFDIVFLDPPFSLNLLAPALEALEKNNLLADDVLVYVEAEVAQIPESFTGFEVYRMKQTARLSYGLLAKK